MKKVLFILFISIILFSFNSVSALQHTNNHNHYITIKIPSSISSAAIAFNGGTILNGTTRNPNYKIEQYRDNELINTVTQGNNFFIDHNNYKNQNNSSISVNIQSYSSSLSVHANDILKFYLYDVDFLVENSTSPIDIFYNGTSAYKIDESKGWVIHDLLEIIEENPYSLDKINPSPGYEEYFIYEQEQSGKIIAEFYKSFPTITFQSNADSNEFSKWKMQHTDFVEVYEFNDQSDDWSLIYKQYQGNWIGFQDLVDEIKIIASSQSISDGVNIYGPDGNVSVNLDPGADTYYKILTPPNNVSTIKNKVRFQIYVNMPMKKEFGILNREYLSTFAPRLYIKSNNIQNPNNINGYLPWIISPIYNSQSSLWWENNNQTNDYFKLVGHVTKNESFGRREIVYTIESDLSIGANNFNFNLEPQFVLISATGSHDVKNGDLISATHSITRVQSVDANNDGIDDNTGESLTDTTPVGDDVLNPGDGHNWLDPDGSSVIDGDDIAIGALEIFNGMMQFATAFTGSIGQIFGFLPPEILALIIFSLSTGVIIGIFKMLT